MNGSDFPSFERITDDVDHFVQGNPGIARCEHLGTSPEGLDVRAILVTDPDASADEKEVAMVVCGRHGNELGTRTVGPALLEHLASPECEHIRRRQVVIVVPVANPDGCVREEFHAPSNRLSKLERDTIGKLADEYRPDLVVDVHSLGDSDIEAIITANTTAAGEDVSIHRALAQKGVEAAGRDGYPFAIHSVPISRGYNNFFCGMCYEGFHSLAFGMEVNHVSLAPDEAAESAVSVIDALLRTRNERLAWQREPEYPNKLLVGDTFTSVRATGRDAAARRASRYAVWPNRNGFRDLSRKTPDGRTLRFEVKYAGRATETAFAMCCRVRGHAVIEGVRINGNTVQYHTHTDDCSTYICGDVEPLAKGAYEMVVAFENSI